MQRVPRAEALSASPPLFQSRWIDRFTRVRPWVPALIFLPAIGALLWASSLDDSLAATLVGIAGGYAFWTLCEYGIHRFVFHLEPRSVLGQRVHFVIHGVHHDHPNDPMRLVMPPVVSVPAGAAFFGLFLGVLSTPHAYPVAAGFYAGYLAYDMVHFALHHAKPRNRVGRLLHQLHMRHHFEDDSCGFGVSAPWWDTVFRTASERTKPARG